MKSPVLQLDIPDVGRNHILSFFLVSVRREIISVQEIYSDSLFIFYNVQISTNGIRRLQIANCKLQKRRQKKF